MNAIVTLLPTRPSQKSFSDNGWALDLELMTICVNRFRENKDYFSPVNNLNFYHATQLFSRCESWRQHFIKKLGFDSFCTSSFCKSAVRLMLQTLINSCCASVTSIDSCSFLIATTAGRQKRQEDSSLDVVQPGTSLISSTDLLPPSTSLTRDLGTRLVDRGRARRANYSSFSQQ